MSRRNGMKPVYIGDVGDTTPVINNVVAPKQTKEELDGMSLHELIAVAIDCGIQLKDLIGVNKCIEHYGMMVLHNDMPEGFNLIEDCKYCKNCFTYFRYKTKYGV